MTIQCHFFVTCTACSRHQSPDNGESPEEARKLATQHGWECGVLVENGSLWDFCPPCVVRRKYGK